MMIVVYREEGERERERERERASSRYSREHFNEYTMQALKVEERSSYLERFDPSSTEW